MVGGPREVAADLESKLHAYLHERLAGRIEVDVATANADQVLDAVRPRFEELEEEHEAGVLERLAEGNRAAVGLEDVLMALNERRVETLVLDEGFSTAGAICPGDGFLAPPQTRACPIDGSGLERLDDVTEAAIELALQQSAEILVMRRRRDEFQELAEGIAAPLRF
jgi:peptide subunit release factor 1 (eRF1)